MTPADRLGAIRGRLAAAAPGPWAWMAMGRSGYPQRITNGAALVIAETYQGPDFPATDADLIANAPTDLAQLCDAVQVVLDLCDEAKRGYGAGEYDMLVNPKTIRAAIAAALEGDDG